MKRLLRDKSGSMIILVPVIFLALFVSVITITEFQRLNTVAENTRDAVQTAMTQVCTDNSKQVFTGAREGYAGGYKLVDASWKPNVTSSDIISKVDAKLGTTNGVKTSGGQMVYEISNLSVDVENAPLAPTGTDGVQQLTGEATYTLTVPHSFGWSALPPMVSHLDVKSAYSPQGPANGGVLPDPGGQQVTGVSLSASDMTMNRGDTEVLSASVSPENAVNRRLTWTSTDNNVCAVTQTGAVTGVGNGSASVVALSAGGAMAACRVTVVSPVTGVTLDKTSVTLNKGAAEQLHATVRPADATNRGVQWGTSNTSICTVDSTGKITAVGAGTATVTVMTQEGGFYADCAVKVRIPVEGLTLDKTSLIMRTGDTDKLTATVYPSGARPDVLWASSNSAVCSVDQFGNIRATGNGSATISATTMDGRYVATCKVQVGKSVTGITINPTQLSLPVGSSRRITATVLPTDATNQGIYWYSSNSSVATVDQSGKVTAVSTGSAVITAYTYDGWYSASCSVSVIRPVTWTYSVNKADLPRVSTYYVDCGNTSTKSCFLYFNATDRKGHPAYQLSHAQVTYQFTQPLVMKAGQTLTIVTHMENTNAYDYGEPKIYINNNYQPYLFSGYNSGGVTYDTYTFPVDTTISSLTAESEFMLQDRDVANIDIEITINSDYGSFLLNNTGTSLQP